jgi:hypothetical protein
MTVEDMVTEAEYFREKLRRHNRYLYGWGVVCGLDVTAAPTPTAPAAVSISGGYALSPYGDEIYVADPVFLDLSRCGPGAATDPCEPDLLHSRPGVGATIFVAIKFSECLAKPVRAMPAGCACEEEDCEYSRVRDSFEICCLTGLPPLPSPIPLCDLRGKPVPCPSPPVSPWVVLARVTLPVRTSPMQIDTTVRRQLFSTSQIQAQVIDCCCDKGPSTQPPLLVISNVRFGTVSSQGTTMSSQGTFTPLAEADLAAQPDLDLTQQVSLSVLLEANAIEVQFAHAGLNQGSVSASNVTVSPLTQGISGDVSVDTVNNKLTWVAMRRAGGRSVVAPPGVFRPGTVYTLTLLGNASGTISPIVDTNGDRLDGEVNKAFPSGNTKQGGNFVLTFSPTVPTVIIP